MYVHEKSGIGNNPVDIPVDTWVNIDTTTKIE